MEPNNRAKLISRLEAIELKQPWFFLGKVCKHGHIAKRSVWSYKCYKCASENQRQDYKRGETSNQLNKEKSKEYIKKYYNKNKETIQQYKRLWSGLPENSRPIPTLCECCGKSPGKRALALDHDHVTGKFRGWLCGKCNSGIGLLGDSIEALERAIKYLQKCTDTENIKQVQE